MELFGILNLELPLLKPKECKIHLASWNGRDEPLDIFRAGDFPAWQNWQSHKNFERPYVVSLIKLSGNHQWLFAGVHSTHGCDTVQCQEDLPWNRKTEYHPTKESRITKQAVRYQTKELQEFAALTGRLIVEFARPGRQSYLIAENWAAQLRVSELKPRRLTIGEFPGFLEVLLPKSKLDIIVEQDTESWKSALSRVTGASRSQFTGWTSSEYSMR